jgi:phosphocarrier protein HPr
VRGAVHLYMVKTKTFEITNQLGIHARVAAKLVETANRFQSEVVFEKDGVEVDGRSILGILTLFCPYGSRLMVRTEGVDAGEAMDAFGRLIENKFGET